MFGAIHIAEGLKTSLAATSEAGNGIVDDALPTVFPLEEKVRFSDDPMTSIFFLPGTRKHRRLPRSTTA